MQSAAESDDDKVVTRDRGEKFDAILTRISLGVLRRRRLSVLNKMHYLAS